MFPLFFWGFNIEAVGAFPTVINFKKNGVFKGCIKTEILQLGPKLNELEDVLHGEVLVQLYLLHPSIVEKGRPSSKAKLLRMIV